jgi:4-oxalocrotonate tautomerase
MPIVHVTTWPTLDAPQKKKLLEGLTRVVHDVTGAPLDKIVAYLTEVNQTGWAEAGVLGSDASFPERSRRRAYEDPNTHTVSNKETV